MRSLGLVVVVAASAAGCHSGNPPAVGRDGGSDAAVVAGDGAAPPGGDAGGSCNAVAQAGMPVQPHLVPSDAPMAMGGPVRDGRYLLTAVEIFSGPQGATGSIDAPFAYTEVVQGTHIDDVRDEGGQETHASATLSIVDATHYTIDYFCPFNGSGSGSFDADMNSMRLYSIHTNMDGTNPLVQVITLERQ